MQSSFLSFILLCGLLGTSGAFPWAGEDFSPSLQDRSRHDPLEGLLGTVATNFSEADRRPDADHPFIEPGPNDQRGACPGLNALANHGYLPRSGITTVAEAVNASNWVFNMGRDVATYLSTLQVSFSGNLDTETFSIGGEDKRTYSPTGIGSLAAGRQWGTDTHARVECDNSPTREDFDLNKGDDHTGVGSRFRKLVEFAKQNGGQFNLTSINQLFAHNVDLSIANNPDFWLDGFQLNGNLGAYAFIGLLYPNGTVGSGGTANYESISSLLGFRINEKGDFCYVPERLPANWYRTTQTFSFPGVFLPTIPTVYNANPYLTNDFGTYLSNVSRSPELVCAQFKSLLDSLPSALAGSSAERIDAAVDYVHVKLVQGLQVDEFFGCTSPRPRANETMLYPLPKIDEKLQIKGQKQRYNVCS